MKPRRLALATSLLVSGFAFDLHAQPCTHACDGADGYYASHEDREKLAQLTAPIVKELAACVTAAGGGAASPAVFVRFDSEGKVAIARVEATGFENHPCATDATKKLEQISLPHETAMRCACGLKPSPPVTTPATPPPISAPVPPRPYPPYPPPQVPYYPTPQTQQPPPAYAYAPRTEKVWYGWQTLLVDAGTVSLTVGGLAARSATVGVLGIVSFVMGAPIVHFFHERIGQGFGSMGYRLLLPLFGMGIGAMAGIGDGGLDESGSGNIGDAFRGANSIVNGTVIGAFIGMGLCVALDGALLSWETRAIRRDENGPDVFGVQARLPQKPTIAVSPFGLAGTF